MTKSKRAHAILSPSSSSRWLNCTPSAKLEDGVTDKGSSYAREGNLSHDYADFYLRWKLGQITEGRYKEAVKRLELNELYSTPVKTHAINYAEYCLEEFAALKALDPTAVAFTEKRVDYSAYATGDNFGRCDWHMVGDKQLRTIDYKFGKGVYVEAQGNTQQMLYALGAFHEHELSYDIERVTMTVYQPRIHNIKSWTVELDYLLTWAENELKPKARLAHAGEGALKVGDWCQFCKVKARCKAYYELTVSTAKQVFSDTGPKEFKDENLVSLEDLAGIYAKAKAVGDWAKKVEQYLLEQAVKGRTVPGYKLIRKSGRRRWADEQKVIDLLKREGFLNDEFLKTSLKGIGDVSGLFSVDKYEKLLKPLIEKPQGGPALVEDDDKREALDPAAEAKKAFS